MTELLINLVEARPVLWDKTLEIYKEKRPTFEAWREIFTTLNNDFEELTDVEKNEYGKSIIRKWSNLRDRWMKCNKRLKETKPGSDVRKCGFYDEMLFLAKITTSMDSDGNMPLTSNVEKSPKNSPIAKKKKKQHDEVDQYKAQLIKTVTKDRDSRAMAFFRSIAPSVDKFSDEEMIDFQFEVIKLVRDTQKRKSLDIRQWNQSDHMPYDYETRQSAPDIPGTSYHASTDTDQQSVSSVDTTYCEVKPDLTLLKYE